MAKNNWQKNLTLIIAIILIIGGYILIREFLINTLTSKFKQLELKQTQQLNPELKKQLENNFDLTLFKTKEFKDLKEFIQLPLIINNQGNVEPFKKLLFPFSETTE